MEILIVDDHPAMRTTLKDLLEEEGYDITTAASGTEGIERCKEKRYDIILLDVRMPDMNGVEAFKQIKTLHRDIRVIMMTAYSMNKLKSEALNEGAVAFLQKPLDIQNVLSIIKDTEQPPVLVVMEDQKEQKKLSGALKKHKYNIHITGSPESSMDLARQIKFNLIMIDTAISRMNALDLYLALKKITPDSTTIIFAENEKGPLEQAREAVKQNAYTYLEKPLDTEKLFSILNTIRHQQRSNYVEKPGGGHGNNGK